MAINWTVSRRTALKAIVQPSDIKPLDAAEIAALNASVTNPADPASQVKADVAKRVKEQLKDERKAARVAKRSARHAQDV